MIRCLHDRDWLPPTYLVDIVFHLQLSPVSYLTNPINSGPLSLVLFLKLQEYKLSANVLTLVDQLLEHGSRGKRNMKS